MLSHPLPLDSNSSQVYHSYMNKILPDAKKPVKLDQSELVTSLVHAGKVTEERLGEALAATGLSVAKWAAISQLERAGVPLALSQLAERLACVRSNATQLVDRLEAEGLVRRAPAPDDRRSIRAELTPEGYRRYQAAHEAVKKFAREQLGRYTPKEQALLIELLGRLDSSGA
jgi:DNA-binding MarR family transcriptional regulator